MYEKNLVPLDGKITMIPVPAGVSSFGGLCCVGSQGLTASGLRERKGRFDERQALTGIGGNGRERR